MKTHRILSRNKCGVGKRYAKIPLFVAYPLHDHLSQRQVALRLNDRPGAKALRQGDTVPYVVCLDDTNNSHTQRAYHPSELKDNPKLKVSEGHPAGLPPLRAQGQPQA